MASAVRRRRQLHAHVRQHAHTQGCGPSGFQQPLLATGMGSGVPVVPTDIRSALESPRATGMGQVLTGEPSPRILDDSLMGRTFKFGTTGAPLNPSMSNEGVPDGCQNTTPCAC